MSSLRPADWGKKYEHPDTQWNRAVQRAEETIQRLEMRLVKKEFCDKWGYLLKVGDTTNYGQIDQIENGYAIIGEQKIHWSELVKYDTRKP